MRLVPWREDGSALITPFGGSGNEVRLEDEELESKNPVRISEVASEEPLFIPSYC